MNSYNFIEQAFRKHLFSVSTDIVGILGQPTDVLDFWSLIVEGRDLHKIGLEITAWSHLLNYDFNKIAGNILGFHGRIGFVSNPNDLFDNLKVAMANKLIAPTPDLYTFVSNLSTRSSKAMYVLVHQPEADALKPLGQIKGNIDNNPMLIENNIHEGALSEAKQALKNAREAGNSAYFVFDLVHFLKEGLKHPDLKNWDQMLDEIRQIGQCFIHLPIGTNDLDSLPFDNITSNMWQGLANIINQNNCYVIIEHQLLGLRQQIYKQPNKDGDLVKLMSQRYQLLLQNRIIRK